MLFSVYQMVSVIALPALRQYKFGLSSKIISRVITTLSVSVFEVLVITPE